jgi:hypothetical protein
VTRGRLDRRRHVAAQLPERAVHVAAGPGADEPPDDLLVGLALRDPDLHLL